MFLLNNDPPQSPRRITNAEWSEILRTEAFQDFARSFCRSDEDLKEELARIKSNCLGAKFEITGAAGVTGDLFLVHLGNCEVDLPFTFYRNWDEKKLQDMSWYGARSDFRNASLVPLSVWARWNKIGVRQAEAWLQEQRISIEELPAVRREKFVRSDVKFPKPRPKTSR